MTRQLFNKIPRQAEIMGPALLKRQANCSNATDSQRLSITRLRLKSGSVIQYETERWNCVGVILGSLVK